MSVNQVTLPRDANNSVFNRAMDLPVPEDTKTLVSATKYADIFALAGQRTYMGIAIYNPSATSRLHICIGPEFSEDKTVIVHEFGFLCLDDQTFGAMVGSSRVRAKLSVAQGTPSSGTLTFAANPTNEQTIVINGRTYEFSDDASPVPGRTKIDIGATLGDTLAAAVIIINSSDQGVTASQATGVLTITSVLGGSHGDSIAISAGTSGATASGATLSGASGGVTPIFHIW